MRAGLDGDRACRATILNATGVVPTRPAFPRGRDSRYAALRCGAPPSARFGAPAKSKSGLPPRRSVFLLLTGGESLTSYHEITIPQAMRMPRCSHQIFRPLAVPPLIARGPRASPVRLPSSPMPRQSVGSLSRSRVAYTRRNHRAERGRITFTAAAIPTLCGPPASIVITSGPGLRLSWIVYRGKASAVTFSPEQMKTWTDSRAFANSPWSPPFTIPQPPQDSQWITQVTFQEPGTYVLRAVASDGSLFTYESVTVTVTR